MVLKKNLKLIANYLLGNATEIVLTKIGVDKTIILIIVFLI
jgi:hypothetical protein